MEEYYSERQILVAKWKLELKDERFLPLSSPYQTRILILQGGEGGKESEVCEPQSSRKPDLAPRHPAKTVERPQREMDA